MRTRGITAQSCTAGCVQITPSSSAGATWKPLYLTMTTSTSIAIRERVHRVREYEDNDDEYSECEYEYGEYEYKYGATKVASLLTRRLAMVSRPKQQQHDMV